VKDYGEVMVNNIRALRQSHGVSSSWLAGQLGIHRATLWSYEEGKTRPPVSLYFQLAHIFHVPLDQVLPKEIDAAHS